MHSTSVDNPSKMDEDAIFHDTNQCTSIKSYFYLLSFGVCMSTSLFRWFKFCSLKLVIDTKNKLIAVQNWYVPTQYTQNVWSGGKMFFVIYSECLYGLSIINSNEVTFLYYAFLKAQSYMISVKLGFSVNLSDKLGHK